VTREALTPAFAPPESFRAEEPSAAADVYSMAATLYALMAGRPPHFPASGESPGMWALLARHGQPVEDIPGAPPRLMDILQACLAADPSRRLPSAASLRDELAALLSGERGRAPSRDWQAPGAPATGSRTGASATPLAGSAASPGTGSPRITIEGARDAGARTVRTRPSLALAAVGGAVAVAVGAALIVVPRLLSPGNGPAGASTPGTSTPAASLPGAVGVFGVATTTEHCPAASVTGAGAACVKTPECWAGVNDFNGVVSASPMPCNQSHTWQTFAIAIMPSESATFNVNIVQANLTVQALCSLKVLLASRTGAALTVPQSAWMIQVMPPDEAAYNTGVRTVRCLAGHGLDELKSAQFGP
jgi:hypothetical protein